LKYEFELTLVVRTSDLDERFGVQSIDTVKGNSLSSLLGQFLVVLASVHKRILTDVKAELEIIDDDIPF